MEHDTLDVVDFVLDWEEGGIANILVKYFFLLFFWISLDYKVSTYLQWDKLDYLFFDWDWSADFL